MAEKCKDELFKDIAPAVINNEMIIKAVDAQRPSGEAGRLSRADGTVLEEIPNLRLEFLNILRIDYLWVLTGLVKLSLSNNMIEKIENLHTLLNLKELDLSFNNIEKIENIEMLVNLEVLTLYNNRISIIENIRSLKKLHIFSIGRNLIENRETIFHLRLLKNLRSVNMAENPCSESEEFRIFIATFLPQIMYYEYKRIGSEERELGLELYEQLLKKVMADEAVEVAEAQREEDERIEAEMHAESFIEFLGSRQLFDSLFEKDNEGKLLLQIPEVEELYNEYETQFLEVTRKLFEVGQERYKTRKTEVFQYSKCVETAKDENQIKCQEAMEKFLEKKTLLLSSIKIKRKSYFSEDSENAPNNIDYVSDAEFIQSTADKFNDLIHETWKELMGLEMNLFDQLEEANLNFERALTELINSFTEEAQGFFTQLRSFETNYMENVFEATSRLIQVYADGGFVPDDLKPMCEDKEIQNNLVAASHDIHMQLIDGREDRLVSKAKLWLTNITANIYKNEISRNRGKILEINHFLDCQRDHMDEIFMETPGLTADLSAALQN